MRFLYEDQLIVVARLTTDEDPGRLTGFWSRTGEEAETI